MKNWIRLLIELSKNDPDPIQWKYLFRGKKFSAVFCSGISADTILACGSDDKIKAIGIKARHGKFHLSIRAIGDRADRVVINSLNNLKLCAIQHHFSIPQNQIEHIQLIPTSDIELLRGSGIVPSMQPFHVISDQKWLTGIGKLESNIPTHVDH
jgi:predicted amidohydrolase YtcJ